MKFYGLKFFGCLVLLLLIGANSAADAPTVEQIDSDIQAFQDYFKQRFPGIELQQYNDGVNALPQYAHRRGNWEILAASPPFETEMAVARKEWQAPFANGQGFAACFRVHLPANKFPAFRDGKVLTIAAAINNCLSSQGEPPLALDSARLARLIAAFREQFNGQLMAIDYSDEGMREIYQQGRQYYWAKRGQNNFSCASCHVENAGNRFRDDVLSAGLGQTTAFPVYRTKWAQVRDGETIQPWGTVHRRYANCNMQAGAAPFQPQSLEYIALEVYQGIMNTGIPLNVPSQRQ